MDEQTTTTTPPPEQSDYAKGYDFGIICDLPGYSQAFNGIVQSGGNWQEFQAGWEDGALDSWLNAFRGDARSLPIHARSYLLAAVANMVLAFKVGVNNNEQS